APTTTAWLYPLARISACEGGVIVVVGVGKETDVGQAVEQGRCMLGSAAIESSREALLLPEHGRRQGAKSGVVDDLECEAIHAEQAVGLEALQHAAGAFRRPAEVFRAVPARAGQLEPVA